MPASKIVPAEGWTLRSCLVVEDDSVILIDIEYTLQQMGLSDVRTATSLENAAALLSASAPECAILDLEIGRQNSIPLARQLMSLQVPLLFLTAHGRSAGIPDDLRHAPVVAKPFTARLLSEAIGMALRQADR